MIKRTVDIFGATVGLIFLGPLIIFLALMVWITMGSPIFFRQKRIGLNGSIFTMIKFRTMTAQASPSGELLEDVERVTPFGNFLRVSSLDELPELLNVVVGEMSLVGPRPLLVEYLKLYSEEQSRRHEVRPGITGWAQINGRNETTWEDRFNHDIWYIKRQSFVLDMKIMMLTLVKVISRSGVTKANNGTMPKFTGQSGQTKGQK